METTLAASLLLVVKVFLWVLLALFIVFSVIVVRQVHLMNRVLSVPISGGIRIASLGLLLFAVTIFVVSLVAL